MSNQINNKSVSYLSMSGQKIKILNEFKIQTSKEVIDFSNEKLIDVVIVADGKPSHLRISPFLFARMIIDYQTDVEKQQGIHSSFPLAK